MLEFLLFFFSSRRRHTRCSRDWSSDVCSSDLSNSSERFLLAPAGFGRSVQIGGRSLDAPALSPTAGIRSEERRVGKSVDLGGRRIIKKKKKEIRLMT